MHDVLSSWERRAVLYYLQERADPAPLDTLASHLAGWRDGSDQPTLAGEDVDRMRTELLHSHVLKLVDFGVLEYDTQEDVVTLVDDVTVAVQPPWEDREGALLVEP